MAEKGTGGKNKIGFENDAIDYAILAFILIAVISASLGLEDIKDVPQFLKDGYETYSGSFIGAFIPWVTLHSLFFKTTATLIMVLSVTGITYLLLRLRRVNVQEYEKYKAIDIESEEAKARQVQWEIILKHMGSENHAEWKLGILEADNILDELLEERGFRGETLGDRLKFAEAKGLKTLNDAWEAHKARNKIVHEEATSPLNKRDARKIIDLYEKVFKELGYL
ncbi:MAG: hypothetical protein HZB11_02095 [Candidatus Yonathbacteria bacterium]|nr:hypothetical protein [Candidatus Yonathbacteria bacterium]